MRRIGPLCAAAFVFVVGAGGAARADLTIVSQSSTKGETKASSSVLEADETQPKTTITYFRKNKMRTEDGKTVEIYDAAANVTYTLYPNKTYTETKGILSISTLFDEMSAAFSQVHIDSKTVVETGEKTRLIAGQKARNYTFISLLTFTADTKTASKISEDEEDLRYLLPLTITVQGEEWTTEALDTGLKFSSAARKEWDCFSAALPRSGVMPKEFVSQMDKIKGISLYSTHTISLSFPPSVAAIAEAQGEKLPQLTSTTIKETKSISKASLDDAIFVTPADYKKVDAPPAKPSAPKAAAE